VSAAAEHRRRNLRQVTPGVYAEVARLERSVGELGLDPALRDLVKIRVSQVNGCRFCIALHTREARARGESAGRIRALAGWRESPLFDERERAALALGEALTRLPDGPPDDVLYETAERALGADGAAALTWTVIAINAWNRVAIASGLSDE